MKLVVPLVLLILGATAVSCSAEISAIPPGGPGAGSSPGDQAPALPATARPEMLESLRDDLSLVRDPSDGGGHAWLMPDQPRAIAGRTGRWELGYETGPLGISEGGAIYLQVSPFWGWSTPQVTNPLGFGYTEVELDPAPTTGARLVPRTLDQQLLGIWVEGGELPPGQRVRIIYGAGMAGAVADRFAEDDSRFWFAVDGDGDGIRKVLEDSPGVRIYPGPPARLLLTLSSTARVNQSFRLTAAILDEMGNTGVEVEGAVTLQGVPDGLELPSIINLGPDDGGRASVEGKALKEGVFRLVAQGPGGLEAESNPLLVVDSGLPIHWGDLHGHSNYSDGTGTPRDYYIYARDVASLDVAALTDHDHWGMLFLDQHPRMWEQELQQAREFYEPGRFVTLSGYEWTNWIYGHRHVLYFQDEGTLFSSLDQATDGPAELWDALRGQNVLTVSHHSAGGPIATDWTFAPDPEFEPAVEVVSVHGSSEAPDSPGRIYSPKAGSYVRDELDRGYKPGFLGSGDSHDGHPGLAHLGGSSGGIAAILTSDLTREGVMDAIRSRRTYATNGARIIIRMAVNGHPMGAALPAGEVKLAAAIFTTGVVDRIDIIRSGGVVEEVDGGGARDLLLERSWDSMKAGEYLYLRVVQLDGGCAWTSPVYIE